MRSSKIVKSLTFGYIAFYFFCLAVALVSIIGTLWVAIHFIVKYW